jgi:hypothetical protein
MNPGVPKKVNEYVQKFRTAWLSDSRFKGTLSCMTRIAFYSVNNLMYPSTRNGQKGDDLSAGRRRSDQAKLEKSNICLSTVTMVPVKCL